MSKKANFFWASYADLMTSLFFIMLVLFVLTVVLMKKQAKATEEELKKIKEIENSVSNLPAEYFEYQPEYKRHSIKQQIQFPSGSSEISSEYSWYLTNVGNSIVGLITRLNQEFKGENIKYMVVIEGMASKDQYPYNFELSYQRALALYRFWLQNNIRFDSNVCEVQIAGSGTGGVGRYIESKDEYKNQRFLIQIIPKIGKMQKP